MKTDRTFRNPKNIKSAIKLLHAVTTELSSRNIQYYLDFGTLIGAMRNNSFIPWDYDIDISLKNETDYKQIPEILKIISKKYNYRTYIYTFNEMAKRREKKGSPTKEMIPPFTSKENYQIAKIRTNKFLFFGKGHLCLDIFFKYNYNNFSYWYAYGRVNRTSQKTLGDTLIPFSFYGYNFFIPKNYDKYLSEVYGDWKTEKENWTNENGSKSAENIESIINKGELL